MTSLKSAFFGVCGLAAVTLCMFIVATDPEIGLRHFKDTNVTSIASVSEGILRNRTTTTTTTAPRDSLKKILLWTPYYKSYDYKNGGFGQDPFITAGCPVAACSLTNDSSLLGSAAAVVFHIRNEVDVFPAFRPPGQLYVFFLHESPLYTVNEWYTKLAGAFNVTMTYRRDSDIPIVVPVAGTVGDVPPYRMEFPLATRKRSVVWVVSHCDTLGKRELYVQELRKHIDVDIYGACGKELICPEGLPDCFRKQIPSRYKFFLSFENSVCVDYVTEKLYRTLRTEIIPVVYGGTNYTRDSPPHSVINTMDFKSPAQLARTLRWLGNSEDAYTKYFQWKGRYTYNSNMRRSFCSLCEIVHNKTYSRTYRDVFQWWSHDTCRDYKIRKERIKR